METNDMKFRADAEDAAPQTPDSGIPPMGEMLDLLFRGFAPLGRTGDDGRAEP